MTEQPDLWGEHPSAPATTDDGDEPFCPTFDEWWAKYPRKQGKQAARRQWQRMGVIGRVLAWRVLPDWIEYVRRTGTTRYVPHGSTFLNQARWEDESPLASLAPERKVTTMPGRNGIERALADARARKALGDGR